MSLPRVTSGELKALRGLDCLGFREEGHLRLTRRIPHQSNLLSGGCPGMYSLTQVLDVEDDFPNVAIVIVQPYF